MKKLTLRGDIFVLAVRFIQYLVLLDIKARPVTGRQGPRPPAGLCRSKCLAVVKACDINVLKLTIQFIVTADTSDFDQLEAMIQELGTTDEQHLRAKKVDLTALLSDEEVMEAEWRAILARFVRKDITPEQILSKCR